MGTNRKGYQEENSILLLSFLWREEGRENERKKERKETIELIMGDRDHDDMHGFLQQKKEEENNHDNENVLHQNQSVSVISLLTPLQFRQQRVDVGGRGGVAIYQDDQDMSSCGDCFNIEAITLRTKERIRRHQKALKK